MASLKIHTFLVHPGKGLTSQPALSGKALTGSGELIDLLANIFHAQPDQRDFEITFRKADDGSKQNDCRDLIVAHQASPTTARAKAIASRLQLFTDNRSGMGLLFVMTGQHGTKYRTVISRFPANQGILAEIDGTGLDVAFLKQVFIKSMSAYKALLLQDTDPPNEYWKGYATDRQAGGSPENISSYWLDDFLAADFSETPKAGTRRLADALKRAVKFHPDQSIKSEIASAATLAPSAMQGKSISIDDFCSHFGLSTDASDAIKTQLSKTSLSSKKFKFDASEFKKVVQYRTVVMESGAMLTAPNSEFDDVFQKDTQPNGQVIYSTKGRVADQRLMAR